MYNSVIYIVKRRCGKRYFTSIERALACFPAYEGWDEKRGPRGERLFFHPDGEYGVVKSAELED